MNTGQLSLGRMGLDCTGSMDLILNLIKIMKNTTELGCDFREFSTALLYSLDLSVVLASVSFILQTFFALDMREEKLRSPNIRGRRRVYLVLLYSKSQIGLSCKLSSFSSPLFFPFYFFNIKISAIPNPLSHLLFCRVM